MSSHEERFSKLKKEHTQALALQERLKGQRDEIHRELRKLGVKPEDLPAEIEKLEKTIKDLKNKLEKKLTSAENKMRTCHEKLKQLDDEQGGSS